MFYNLKNNNKGFMGEINLIIIVVMIMLLIAFTGDLLKNISSRINIIRQVNYVARVAGRQGGFLDTNPESDWRVPPYPGTSWHDEETWDDDVSYITTSMVKRSVEEAMNSAGIPRSNWDIYIQRGKGGKKYKLGEEIEVDFADDIIISGQILYAWSGVNNRFKVSELRDERGNNLGNDSFDKVKVYKTSKKVASERFSRHGFGEFE